MNDLTAVEQFYLHARPLVNRDMLHEAIQKHVEYKTITVLQDKDGISGLIRFDVLGECASVLDLIIREGLERKGMIKLLAIESWHKFPYLRFFRFERMKKYPNRTPRAYALSRIMKGN